MTGEQLSGTVALMGSTIILHCEQCGCDVEVIVANSEILDGLSAEDDTHITEGHDLSGDYMEGLA